MRGFRFFLMLSVGAVAAGCGGGDPPAGGGDAGAVPMDDAGAECAGATLVAPVPDGEGWLGPMADADGDPCGETFVVDVVVDTDAEDGVPADLVVNRTVRASATVSGGRLAFDGVALDNRGTEGNELSVSFSGCASPLGDLQVDCAGVSCALVAPDTSSATLGPADDVDAVAPGVQVDVEVRTDGDAVGEGVVLIVDGAEVAEVDAAPEGTGALAVFEAVDLEAGERVLQASCHDGRGNVTQTGVARFTVTD